MVGQGEPKNPRQLKIQSLNGEGVDMVGRNPEFSALQPPKRPAVQKQDKLKQVNKTIT
jgi:hypothetical protein